MSSKALNSGIIYTKPNCIGCSKCISGCVAVGANVVVDNRLREGHAVLVDPNKCILCGSCVTACMHHARTYRDDTDAFFEALTRGESITILVSPMLLADYEMQYHNVLGYLKHLGVNHIYNTGFGADIMVWVSMNLVQTFGLSGVISQVCPVIVNYLEKYKPQLLSYLLPVQSPSVCTAIYISEYLHNTDKLAFISPCIAKKHEIEDVNTYGKISYNVTIERLMKRLEDIDLSGYHALDEISYGLGALVSIPGGLSDNVERYIGFDEVLIQTEGPNNIFPYFDQYYKEVSSGSELPFLVDALSCTNGCNFGTGTHCGIGQRNEMTFSTHRMKENAYSTGNVSEGATREERLATLNKRFEQFQISPFVRQYDSTRMVSQPLQTEAQLEQVFIEMHKHTSQQRHTDCGACGYHTCREMAYAVGVQINTKENCISYSKECIRLETEKINKLLGEISAMNDELKKSSQLKSNFLANMSHEIRTPMNAIIGMAEMALRGELPAEERGYIRQIKSSGRSLLAIINDILDFSKIESGKMELSETEYSLASLLNDTVNIVMTRIGEKNITLVINIDPDTPRTLYGDDIRIKQILVNLANNAVKFTEEGCVEISLQQQRTHEGVMLSFAVRDTGIGIKPEDIEKLFTSFEQMDSKRNRNVEGTGLGLAISREFVRLMQGMVFVESTYGQGSTFSFRIPQRVVDEAPCVALQCQEEVRTASMLHNPYVREGYLKAMATFDRVHNLECESLNDARASFQAGATFFFVDYHHWCDTVEDFVLAHPNVQTTVILDPRKDVLSTSLVRKLHVPVYVANLANVLNGESFDADPSVSSAQAPDASRFEAPDAQVLIVDDNAINLTVAKGLLSPLHMNITVASSAREALGLLEAKGFDLVFMDHMMPEIDGVEATHLIRAKEDPYYQALPIIALTANAINNAKEMFLREGMNDFVAKPIEMMDITAKLRKWLPAKKIMRVNDCASSQEAAAPVFPHIEGIDVVAGLSLSGSPELYRSVLADYYAAIEKKANAIEQFEADGNVEGYTIEVHALKSASRLIGAMALADLAALLEECGHKKDVATLRTKTPELLRCYRAYLHTLAPFAKAEAAQTVSLSPQSLQEKLQGMEIAMEDFDIDTAKALMDELAQCILEEQDDAARKELSEAVYAMEYDTAVALAQKWAAALAQGTALC